MLHNSMVFENRQQKSRLFLLPCWNAKSGGSGLNHCVHETNLGIEIVVSAGALRQNAAIVAEGVTRYGVGLCAVTKVLRLSPALLRDTGLKAYPLYDTDTENGAVILDSGGFLVCDLRHRETFLKEQAGSRRVSYIATTLRDVAGALEKGIAPQVYLDINEGREGITPDNYAQLAAILKDADRDSLAVFANARCDLSAAAPESFFTLLGTAIATLEGLGVAVRFISLGGSVLLGCLEAVGQFRKVTKAQMMLRAGESVVVGTVPDAPQGLAEFPLVQGMWVRLPILGQKGPDRYLVAGGYPCLEMSGINAPDCVIERQWSEQAIIRCSPAFVRGEQLQIPLTYSGAARLKVHRDAEFVLVP